MNVKKNKALPLTIILGTILLFICLALTTLWISNYSQLNQFKDYKRASQFAILGIGSFFFLVIIIGVILFIIFMAKQIIINQLQKNFIDSITHELKTPLTSIKLYVETIKKHNLDQNKKEAFCNTMLNDIDRLDNLVNHILEAAKVENIKNYSSVDEIDLKELILYSIDIVKKRYNLSSDVFDLDLNNIKIQSEPNALKLVLINLLDNAIKYSKNDIRVLVKLKKNSSNKVIIYIEDFGVGIPQNEIKKIFKRFYRIEESNKKGSGLGLFIVKETLKKLKGKVSVKSKGMDQGSVFEILLLEKVNYV